MSNQPPTREVLDDWCEKGILALVLALLVYGPLAMGGMRNQEWAIQLALILAASALWLLRIWINRDFRILWPPVCWGVLAFVIYALAWYPNASVEYSARSELIRVLGYGLLFFVVLNNLNHRRSTKVVSWTLIGLAALLSLYAMYQFLTRSDMVWDFVRPAQYAGRGSATYICPNHLAGWLIMVLPIALGYVMIGRFKPTARIICGYLTLTILVGLGVTVSRGGMLAAGMSMLVFFAVIMTNRASRIPAILLLTGLGIAAGAFILNTTLTQARMDKVVNREQVQDVRFHLWKPAVEIWKENPWLGAGPAQFDHRFRTHRPPQVQARAMRVHNDYLNTLTDWGILGVAIVTGAWVAFFAGVFAAWRKIQKGADELAGQKSNRSAFLLGAVTGLAALLFHSVVDFNFHVPANAVQAVALMALVAGHCRFVSEKSWLNGGWIGKGLVTIFVGLGICWLAGEARLKHAEAKLHTRSMDPELPLDEEMIILRRMAALEPMNPETAFRIGEGLRLLGWDTAPGYYPKITEAQDWFLKTMRLDPHDAYACIRYGMCLDLLREYKRAEPFFLRGQALDPNGAFTLAHVGWHYVQTEDHVKAREVFKRSLAIDPWHNPIATTYMEILDEIDPLKPAAPNPQP